MKDFLDKRVFITGGSSGIGLATAKMFSGKGAHVIIFARHKEFLTHACKEIEEKRINPSQMFSYRPLDVTNHQMVKDVMAEVVETFGPPDILINSAGRSCPDYFEEITYDNFDLLLKTNLYGVWNTTSVLVPSMKKKGGAIVNVSSVAGFVGEFGYTDYCASKFAVIGFSEALKQELALYNILVSVLCPPDTETPMLAEENLTKPDETKAISSKAKILQPDKVAYELVKGIQRRKFMILPGFDAKLTYYVKRLFPWVVDFIMMNEVRKVQRKKRTYT